jgi:hypothetical protein
VAGQQGNKYTIKSAAYPGDNGKTIKARVFALAGSLDSTNATLTVIPDTFPPVPQVGTIIRNDGVVEVGVGFDEAVNTNDLVAGNFSLVGGTGTLKFPTNTYGDYKGVLFDTTGLVVGNTYTVHVANVRDLKGNAIPAAGVNVPFKVSNRMGWADTGTPVRPGQVIPVGTDGFDVLNGGRQEWSTYDEATIAYVKKTNDFDVKVQVVYAEPGSQWTRVGLIARNDLNVGEPPDDRNSSTGNASAYAQTHVNPSDTIAGSSRFDPLGGAPSNPTPNNSHEQNQRLAKGAASSSWQSSNAGPPSFPDVWLRLRRAGTNITGYASADGSSWDLQGTTSLTDQQPNMFVGPVLTVETGNIWSAGVHDVWAGPFDPIYDRLFVAQFRNFGNTFPPSLSIARSGNQVTITFTGLLLSASSLAGPWTAVTTTTPYVTTATGTATYYRAQD